jgi:RNA polymerase sigma factor (sigma-70 family)
VSEDYDFDKDFEKKDYEPWLRKLVKETLGKFSPNPRWDFDELMSEAWLALVESSQTFDPKVSNSFLGYAKPYIYKRLLEFIGVNMYTLKARYYNIKDDPEKMERINRIESALWTSSKGQAECKGMVSHEEGYKLSPLDTATSGVNTEECVAIKEETDIVRQIVNTELPKKQRRALVRRFKFDESYRDIAKHMKCSPEAARHLVITGLEKLKWKVKDAGINSI